MEASRKNAKPTLLRRVLACLVSAAMVVAFTPVVAWGAEGGTAGDVDYLYCDENGANWQTGTKHTGEYTVITASFIKGNGYKIGDGWYVVNEDATMGGFSVDGDAHLILEDGCTLTANIDIPSGKKLTIYAQSEDEATMGKLITGSAISAGILMRGGGLTINGGIINASGQDGAGIGGSNSEPFGGTVTINGGVVNAHSTNGAGIGGGTDSSGCDGGVVTINGGIVTATSEASAGIGGGLHGGGGGTVTINGGTVTASSGTPTCASKSAGIGGGSNGDSYGNGANVTITGGDVTASTTSKRIFAIGFSEGDNGSNHPGTLTVTGGTVTVKGGTSTALETFYNDSRSAGIKPSGDSSLVAIGNLTIPVDLTIPKGKTLTIPSGASLTVPEGKTLTNRGTISIEGTGTLTNSGAIKNFGTISGTVGSNQPVRFYDIAYELNGGANDSANPSEYAENSGAIALQPAEKAGYTFAGWYQGGEKVSGIPENSSGDKTFTARWLSRIAFDANGGSCGTSSVDVPEDSAFQDVVSALPTPDDRTGYTFEGWYTEQAGGAKVEEATAPAGNATLYAHWKVNQYTITFITDGGTAIYPITQDYATAVKAPDNPTKTGYTFKGWDKEVPATMPAENVTITATWDINQYTITFDTDGGSEVAPIIGDYNSAVIAPANPTKTGYTFAGWDKEIPGTIPAENVTIKANWTINQYTITFDTDGGSPVAAITQDYGTDVTAPADPTRSGYTFAGWDREIPSTMPAEDMTITAKWNAIYVPDPTPPAPEVGETVENVSLGGGSVEASVTVTGGATTDSQGNKVDGSVSIGGIAAGEGAVTIPETVTVNGKTYLVTEVEPGALAGNTAVESVTLPASVTVIGAGAFEGCTELASVNVPAGVIRIEADTFAGCTALESVKLEGEVTEVGPSAFSGCTSLEAIDLPAAVSTVGEGAFAGCTSLKGIELSASGAVIGKGAFEDCSSLARVKLPAGAVIGARAFANSGIAKLTLPANAVVGERAFQGCTELKSVTVSKGVKALPAYAFKGCAKLAKVTLPSGIIRIERSAFSGCKSLRSIVLPKSVVAIGKNALYGASKAKKLTVESKQLTKKGVKDCLKGSSVTTVYVPKSKLDAYSKLFTKSVCGKKVTLKPIK